MLAFPALAVAGLVLLGFVRPRGLRWLGRLLTFGVALGASWLAAGLVRLGEARGWTGEGPGMLVVMLLVPVAGALALAGWGAVLAQWRLGREGGVSPRLALGLLAVGLAGSAWQADEQVRRARPSHDAPIVAVAFAQEGARLLSLDADGALKEWDVARRRVVSARRDPALAGAHALLVAPAGDVAVALGPRGALVLRLGAPESAPLTLPGVEHAVLLPGDRLAWAAGEELRFGTLPAPDPARAGLALGAAITALATDREGALAAALADGRLVALGPDGEPRRVLGWLPAPATRLLRSPGGAWLAASDAAGRAHVADLRRGGLRPLAPWLGLHRAAFVADDLLVFTSSEESPEARALSLAGPEPQAGPWLNHGQSVTALGAAPGRAEAAVALGPQLFLARAPRRPGDPPDAERLVDPR